MPRASQAAGTPRHRLRRRQAIAVVPAALGLLAASACGQQTAPQAQEAEHVLIAGHQLAEGTSFDQGLNEFADIVQEESDGRVQVEVYPAAQLGGETDLFENMRNGTADVAVVAPGFIAEFVPEMSLLSMPFLVTSRDQRDTIIDGPVGTQMEELLVAETGEFKRWVQGTLRVSLMVSDSPASCVAGR